MIPNWGRWLSFWSFLILFTVYKRISLDALMPAFLCELCLFLASIFACLYMNIHGVLLVVSLACSAFIVYYGISEINQTAPRPCKVPGTGHGVQVYPPCQEESRD